MPELPEVETVRRTLDPCISGRTVTTLLVLWEGALVNMSAGELQERLLGAQFIRAERRGKYLGLLLTSGAYLIIHLRMTGRFLVRCQDAPWETHLRLLIKLDNQTELHFVDQRKFGKVYWAADTPEFATVAHVGPEPLADNFTPSTLAAALQDSKTSIKARLLNQDRVAGLGNIYADESLFRAHIHPERPAGSLSHNEVEQLWQGIRESLQAGLEHGGTTLRDYVDSSGRQGEHQNYLLVYGKAGEPCSVCGATLVRTRVAGRGTVYCPVCQK